MNFFYVQYSRITTILWMWIGFNIFTAFHICFVLRLHERGLFRCGLVSYVVLSFNRTEGCYMDVWLLDVDLLI